MRISVVYSIVSVFLSLNLMTSSLQAKSYGCEDFEQGVGMTVSMPADDIFAFTLADFKPYSPVRSFVGNLVHDDVTRVQIKGLYNKSLCEENIMDGIGISYTCGQDALYGDHLTIMKCGSRQFDVKDTNYLVCGNVSAAYGPSVDVSAAQFDPKVVVFIPDNPSDETVADQGLAFAGLLQWNVNGNRDSVMLQFAPQQRRVTCRDNFGHTYR